MIMVLEPTWQSFSSMYRRRKRGQVHLISRGPNGLPWQGCGPQLRLSLHAPKGEGVRFI